VLVAQPGKSLAEEPVAAGNDAGAPLVVAQSLKDAANLLDGPGSRESFDLFRVEAFCHFHGWILVRKRGEAPDSSESIRERPAGTKGVTMRWISQAAALLVLAVFCAAA